MYFVSKCSYLYIWIFFGEALRQARPVLFALPEHQVHEAADESHGEADPGQDVGGAVRAVLETRHVEGVFLRRVDGYSDHHT